MNIKLIFFISPGFLQKKRNMQKKVRLLIYSYNTTGMGPLSITRALLTELPAVSFNECLFILPGIRDFLTVPRGKHTFFFPAFSKPWAYLSRVFVDFWIFPFLTAYYQPEAILVLANYSPLPCSTRKIVYLRHSYLVQKNFINRLSFSNRFVEILRKILFLATLITTDKIIVQSPLMRNHFINVFGNKKKLEILPNPVIIGNDTIKTMKKTTAHHSVLYIARFYPHKNHAFLSRLVTTFQKELRKENIKFFITVDEKETPEARKFLKDLTDNGLEDLVINLGELPPEKVWALYKSATCLFHPSKTETFGNTLTEAMKSGLPIVAPRLGYVQEICKNCAFYYQHDSTDDAYRAIMKLCHDIKIREQLRQRGFHQSKDFIDIHLWWKKLCQICLQ